MASTSWVPVASALFQLSISSSRFTAAARVFERTNSIACPVALPQSMPKRAMPFWITGFPSRRGPAKARIRRRNLLTSGPPLRVPGWTTTGCQMFAVLSGRPRTVRIARPRIWLLSTKLPTVFASTRLLITGASQPSPSRDLVPTMMRISPSVNSWVIQPTLYLLARPPVFTMT